MTLQSAGDLGFSWSANVHYEEPDLTLDKVTVVPARACDDCLGVDLALSGTLSTEGMLKITVPLTVSAHAEVSVEAVPDGDEWVVRADIAEVSDLRLTLGKRLPAALHSHRRVEPARTLHLQAAPCALRSHGAVVRPVQRLF